MSEAYFRRGISKLASKNFHDAIKDFGLSEDLEEMPTEKRNAGIPDGIGQCFHSLRDFDHAMSYYDQAIEMDDTNTDFLMHRSQCYYDQKKYDNAIADLETGLSISPNDPLLFYQLGLSFYADEQYKNAVRAFKNALLNKPMVSHEPDIYYHIGLSYCNVEKYEKAIYPFTRCIEQAPSEIKYIHERAKAYQMIEDHENALFDFDSVI